LAEKQNRKVLSYFFTESFLLFISNHRTLSASLTGNPHQAEMDSSRIFIKGLPPSITEPDFKKHFSSGGREVTDARLFVNRRIGYVGYKTPEDAQSAVKYFNKTFVRMSRIGVEVARPIGESNPGRTGGRAPTAARENPSMPIDAPKAQTDTKKQSPEDDAKLKEYLEVMKPKSKKRTWENDDGLQGNSEAPANDDTQMATEDVAASDDEYENVPRKAKRTKVDPPSAEQPITETTTSEVATAPTETAEEPVQDGAAPQAPVSDADWARSRTSRLLGLLDDDEEDETSNRPKGRAASVSSNEDITRTTSAPSKVAAEIKTPLPVTAPDEPAQPDVDAEPTGVRASMRLFVRNLPYDVQQEDLQSEFASYGNIEEVSITSFPSPIPHFSR
jgi:multiple RNA-binding domain-containing protein 1